MIVALAGDSLLKKTLPETANFAFEVGKEIWPVDNELSRISRVFFLGLTLYTAAEPKKVPTLREIYRILTLTDVAYALVVVLDTSGKFLSPLANTLITQWLSCDKRQREQIVFHMTGGLVDFAMNAPKLKKDDFQGMRNSLRQSLLENAAA